MDFIKSTDDVNYTETIQNLIMLYFKHDYESIHQILKIESNYNNEDEFVNKYQKNNGMIFYPNDNPLIQTRIYVDKETKFILNTLLMVTSNSVNEKDVIDLMINKWIKNVDITGLLDENYPIPLIIGKETYVQLKVGKRCWDDLSKACKNKDVILKVGFKMAVLNYLNEICSNEI